MPDNTLQRTLAHDLSTRGDGRTVFGIAVPFDQEARVNDGAGWYTEIHKRGSFAKSLRERGDRIKLLVNHDKLQRLPIGRATMLREDAAGLYGEFRVSQTREGDEALTLINDGVVDAFSVGFAPIKEREVRPGVIERTETSLGEVSVVSFPAFVGAAIAGIRSDLGIGDDEWERVRSLVRDHPELLIGLDTPDVGAVSEPAKATRDDEPPVGHSSPPSTPSLDARHRAELELVRERVAAAFHIGVRR
jgi:HK97 family phage prohead protease